MVPWRPPQGGEHNPLLAAGLSAGAGLYAGGTSASSAVCARASPARASGPARARWSRLRVWRELAPCRRSRPRQLLQPQGRGSARVHVPTQVDLHVSSSMCRAKVIPRDTTRGAQKGAREFAVGACRECLDPTTASLRKATRTTYAATAANLTTRSSPPTSSATRRRASPSTRSPCRAPQPRPSPGRGRSRTSARSPSGAPRRAAWSSRRPHQWRAARTPARRGMANHQQTQIFYTSVFNSPRRLPNHGAAGSGGASRAVYATLRV